MASFKKSISTFLLAVSASSLTITICHAAPAPAPAEGGLAGRVLDRVVEPVDGGEGRVPDADAVRLHCAFLVAFALT